jgi:hypothetical protein
LTLACASFHVLLQFRVIFGSHKKLPRLSSCEGLQATPFI